MRGFLPQHDLRIERNSSVTHSFLVGLTRLPHVRSTKIVRLPNALSPSRCTDQSFGPALPFIGAEPILPRPGSNDSMREESPSSVHYTFKGCFLAHSLGTLPDDTP